MSDVRCPMSDVRCPMSDVRCPMSDARCPMPDAHRQTHINIIDSKDFYEVRIIPSCFQAFNINLFFILFSCFNRFSAMAYHCKIFNRILACFIHRFTLSNMKCPFFEVRHQKSVNYFCCQMKDARILCFFSIFILPKQDIKNSMQFIFLPQCSRIFMPNIPIPFPAGQIVTWSRMGFCL